jgi:hypothetical protein
MSYIWTSKWFNIQVINQTKSNNNTTEKQVERCMTCGDERERKQCLQTR